MTDDELGRFVRKVLEPAEDLVNALKEAPGSNVVNLFAWLEADVARRRAPRSMSPA